MTRKPKGATAIERIQVALNERGARKGEELPEGVHKIVGVSVEDVVEVLKNCGDDEICRHLLKSLPANKERMVFLQSDDLFHVLDKHAKK